MLGEIVSDTQSRKVTGSVVFRSQRFSSFDMGTDFLFDVAVIFSVWNDDIYASSSFRGWHLEYSLSAFRRHHIQ